MPESLSASTVEVVTGIERKDGIVRDMLCRLMRTLAIDEDKVEVICVGMPEGISFHVHCCPDDVGRLIGNRGRTARAIRAILKAIASKNGRRYILVISQ